MDTPSLFIYFIVFFFISLIAFISIAKEVKKYNFIILCLITVFLSLFASLKTDYPDHKGYQTYFYEVSSLEKLILNGEHNYNNIYGVESGYLFLNSLIKYFFRNDTVFFVIVAFMTVGIVVYCCRRMSPYPLLSILCYYSWFYYSALGGIRHALASAFILLMVFQLSSNSKFISMPAYIAGVSIHRSAFPGLFLIFGDKIVKKTILHIGLIVLLIISMIAGGIGKDLISLFIPYANNATEIKLSYYLSSDRLGAPESLIRGVVFKQIIICMLCVYYFKILEEKYNAFPILFFCYLIGLCTLIIFQDFKIVTDRVSHMFSISEIILIPMLFYLVSKKEKTLIFILINGCLFYQFSTLVGDQYHPYTFLYH